MNTHADKIQENKKQTASHTVIQKERNSTPLLPFTDNRPATVAQIQLQEIANNSEQVKQATQLQTMVNTNSTLPIQKKGEEEEELQMKSIHATTQLAGMDEEELLQGKFETAQRVEDEELLQGKFETVQRAQDEELLQGKFEPVEKPNNTGLPNQLKAGIENLSGMSMDHVKVHYNSDKPAQLQAHAYAQGSEIHVASGQEKHLPHEAWHVVQQAQGRVRPTLQMKGDVPVNDDVGLEAEADAMGAKASRTREAGFNPVAANEKISDSMSDTIQRKIIVGILKYNAEQAETRVKGLSHFAWMDVYRQVLTSLDKADERFKNVDDLTDKLALKGYMNEASNGWAEKYGKNPGEGTSLHDIAFKVISEAIGDQSAISGMSYDKIFKYTPETQLAYCLWECRDEDEDVLALCLYTSYFYEPLNKYFRGLSEPDEGTPFGRLIIKTAKTLKDAYEEEDTTEIAEKRYRLELKSGWINGGEENIDFGALTSTHPDLDGVKKMWGDVAKGIFGEYDNLALLTFEGTAKIKRPGKKYFPGESEDLMGPGTKYRIIDWYVIEGVIPGIGQKQIRVFRLCNIGHPKVETRLNFTDVI